MTVARSYEKFEIQGEPFKESGRWYVNVMAPKGLKKVRWYSDAERAAQDRKAGVEEPVFDFNAKHAFGFDEAGYIIANVFSQSGYGRTGLYTDYKALRKAFSSLREFDNTVLRYKL